MAHLINVPPVTCGNGLHAQIPEAEPVFHFVQSDGHHGIAGLETVKAWARDIRDTGTPLYMIVSDLYILLPNTSEMIRCLLGVATGDDGPEVRFEALEDLARLGTVYTCTI